MKKGWFLLLICFLPFASNAGVRTDFAVRSARVVDGDTLARLGSRGKEEGPHLRLWGIDAPEQGADFYWAAGARLETILRTGLPLRCAVHSHDRNGRIVARCFTRTGEDVAGLLVRSGLARDWPFFSKGEYAAEERAARRNRRGMWATPR